MIDFIEIYAYSQLVIIFAFIIALAVIGMAYGGKLDSKDKNDDINVFLIEYMISITLVPSGCTLMTLAIKNKL